MRVLYWITCTCAIFSEWVSINICIVRFGAPRSRYINHVLIDLFKALYSKRSWNYLKNMSFVFKMFKKCFGKTWVLYLNRSLLCHYTLEFWHSIYNLYRVSHSNVPLNNDITHSALQSGIMLWQRKKTFVMTADKKRPLWQRRIRNVEKNVEVTCPEGSPQDWPTE